MKVDFGDRHAFACRSFFCTKSAGLWEDYDERFGILVMGHMPVQKLDERFWVNGRPLTAPLFLDNITMCDTGCSMGGGIGCVDVLSRHYRQC